MAANLEAATPGTAITRPLFRLNARVMEALAEEGRKLTSAVRDQTVAPEKRKVLRTFPGHEVVNYLGSIAVETLYRRLKRTPTLPQGIQVNARRRDFTLEDIHALQLHAGIRRREVVNGRPQERRFPGQRGLVASICNFKGGVAKTTTTAHLGQYLTLMGYRVLLIDLDAQASLTSLFGILPNIEVDDKETLRPIMEGPTFEDGSENGDYDPDLGKRIRRSHWHDLDLLVSNLGVYGSEFAIANRLQRADDEPFVFYRPLAEHLEPLRQQYDVILLDTAPSLSFLNSNAMFAADALVITLPPAMLDVSSVALFFQLMSEVVGAFDRTEPEPKQYDFGSLMLTKFKPNDTTHQQISTYVRTSFPELTCINTMIQSAALEKVGADLQTLYEVAEYDGDRRTFERALDATNAGNGELESLIRRALEAREAARSQSDGMVNVRVAAAS
jgi:chromosome partitioning protein